MSLKVYIGTNFIGPVVFLYEEIDFKGWEFHSKEDGFTVDNNSIFIDSLDDKFLNEIQSLLMTQYNNNEDPFIAIGYDHKGELMPLFLKFEVPQNPLDDIPTSSLLTACENNNMDINKAVVLFNLYEFIEIEHLINKIKPL